VSREPRILLRGGKRISTRQPRTGNASGSGGTPIEPAKNAGAAWILFFNRVIYDPGRRFTELQRRLTIASLFTVAGVEREKKRKEKKQGGGGEWWKKKRRKNHSERRLFALFFPPSFFFFPFFLFFFLSRRAASFRHIFLYGLTAMSESPFLFLCGALPAKRASLRLRFHPFFFSMQKKKIKRGKKGNTGSKGGNEGGERDNGCLVRRRRRRCF